MAAGDLSFGARSAALPNIARLNSVATGEARTFGEYQNLLGSILNDYWFSLPITVAGTGNYKLYLVQSQDGAEWTDGIDPTVDTGDVLAQIEDAILLKTITTVYDATNRITAQFNFGRNLINIAEYHGFVLINNSGVTTPASGADANYMEHFVS